MSLKPYRFWCINFDSSLGIIHLVRTQNFPKNYRFLFPDSKRPCAYQDVRNISFSEDFAYALNEWPLLDSRCKLIGAC